MPSPSQRKRKAPSPVTTARLRRDLRSVLTAVEEHGEAFQIRRYREVVGYIVPAATYDKLVEAA
jgi:hypothetical protein